MARLADMLGNAKRMDLYRYANNENVPKRGRKKHESQMSNKEKDYLFTKLRGVKRWGMSTHAVDRITEKGIEVSYNDVVSTIHNSTIIEYHLAKYQDEKDVRVLLRSNARVNRDYNLHVVFSITRGRVVSVWMNHKDDFHATLDMRDYDKNVKILGA
jgi:hypothetical protein